MDSLFHDKSRLSEYNRRAQERGQLLGPEACEVHVLEWPPSAALNSTSTNLAVPSMKSLNISTLLAQHEPRLRIIFAPLDRPNQKSSAGIQYLFRHYCVPSDFISQRLQSVTHSFSALSEKKLHTSWFHFLCKHVTVFRPPGEYDSPRIVDPNWTELSQGDRTWVRSGFYLRWSDCDDPDKSTVTLLIFSASPGLFDRFESLCVNPDWRMTLVDPFSLYVLILDELWLQAESIVRGVADAFGSMERAALDFASGLNSTANSPGRDFVGLHNMAKHIIYLRESSQATLLMAEHLYAHHTELLEAPPQGNGAKDTTRLVHQMLAQKVTQLEGWKLRMETMEKRMANVINLSFNMVTQQDSSLMVTHSTTMKAIAAVTMFFLPATTIATIFGCEFFSSNAQTNKLVVSSDFWIFWCLVIPCSLLVFLLYWKSTALFSSSPLRLCNRRKGTRV